MNVLFLHGSLHGQWLEIPPGSHHYHSRSGHIYHLHHYVGSDGRDRPLFILAGQNPQYAMDEWQAHQDCPYCARRGHSEHFTTCPRRKHDAELYAYHGRLLYSFQPEDGWPPEPEIETPPTP